MPYSSHVDTYARDHLPAPAAQPDFLFGLPELQFPERLNCATELLDRHVKEGRGDRRCVSAPGGPSWTYAQLQRQADRLASAGELTKFVGGTENPVVPAADASARARENLIHVLFNHNDFVTIH